MAITLKKKNFAKSTLAGGISDVATSLTVATGEGAKFPSTGKFRAVIWSSAYSNPSDDPSAEIVEAELSSGDAFNITRGKEGTSAHAWSAGDRFVHTITAETIEEVGQVVQAVHYQTGEFASGTTIIPLDDTIPQNTEGTQFMSASITPKDASNRLLIEAVCLGAYSVTTTLTGALFKDSDADALAASLVKGPGNYFVPMVLRHEMAAGTTNQITFKVRIGGADAGTYSFNGLQGARVMGGVAASSLRITEIKA